MRSANSGRLGSLVVHARRNNYNKKPTRPRQGVKDSPELTDFRKSKTSLSKSKEKVSAEEEKLLSKEEEAKVVTRVDMADARYVVEDHRNGDANIELDANKRQFTGLTKEELMKYAEDPFWVRLRWFMFILFWSLWLCMLAAAIAIIVRAPKCTAPPKIWYEKGPLVDMSSVESFEELETELPLLKSNQVEGIFTYVCRDTYEVLEEPSCLQKFKDFVTKAKNYGIKVIVDLTANSVSTNHTWFTRSENRSAGYEQYFVWADGAGFGEDNTPNPPNNWISIYRVIGETVFTLSETSRPELFLLSSNVSAALRPAAAAPLAARSAPPAPRTPLAAALAARLPHHPAIQARLPY
ncbi:PREDICTED: 4F2 cell-surface antigen heavy chain [Papilio polytes]|uniref:4F2 cell-surface antigen heavy chain n=1 Tax=Papilio polytes TaxID=76194 RepID=UPI000675C914|nr:PREDICTED: 4F2 cell-surface antigen heavy chain [Papilio polytes]